MAITRSRVFLGAALTFSVLARIADAGLGLDVSSPFSVKSWNCWQSANPDNQLAIVRAGRTTGKPDFDAPESLNHAASAGYAYRHVYIFPCATTQCPSASEQAVGMIQNLRSQSASFTKVWIDIEVDSKDKKGVQHGSHWSTSDTAGNQRFLIDLIGGLKSQNLTTQNIGIYTREWMWQQIMGADANFHSYALWWIKVDENPSFSNFSPFNGWTTPCIKQYSQDKYCSGIESTKADKNYYESTACF